MGTDGVFHRLGGGEINNRGEVVFSGYLLDEQAVLSFGAEGVWTDAGGNGLRLVLLEGQPAPGAPEGFYFKTYSSTFPYLSDSGKIAIWRSTSNGTDVRHGVWEESETGLRLLAYEGAQAPGTEPGAFFKSIRPPEMNSAGQLVFEATLQQGPGGVTEANDGGIWAQDRDGNLRLVIREGDMLQVAPNTWSTVSHVSFERNDPQQVINDLGQIVLHARFTDLTQAIVMSNAVAIPGPQTWLLAIGFALMLSRARYARRNRQPR
jgi:hypothetical protein